MLLGILSVLIIAIVAFVYFLEGLLTAFAMFFNVLLAGLIAFNFFEPLSDLLDPGFSGGAMHGHEDFLCLVLLFSLTLGLLRLTTNGLARTHIEFHPILQNGGSVLFGAAAGYMTVGFLLCALQTLPWHEEFMGFSAEYDPAQQGAAIRRVLPPDRAWLALMNRAGRIAFSTSHPKKKPDETTFDPSGSFEIRYWRYRRYGDNRDPLPYQGETTPLKE